MGWRPLRSAVSQMTAFLFKAPARAAREEE